MTDLLITGGTGSLGQNLVERLLSDEYYSRICVYSRDEHKQAAMAEKFGSAKGAHKLRFFLGDVRDLPRLNLALHTFSSFGVPWWHIVHAAALKIVPSGEYNPFEVIKTNVLGTQNVIDAALTHGVVKVVLVSSDKAVNPINLYGATKLCAEKLILAAQNIHGPTVTPKFCVVRYGNVANSNGSVIPKFIELAKQNKPLPITHPNMTRFWITLNQACAEIEHALFESRGGEVFIPKMRTFYVVNLARAIQTLYKSDAGLVYVGMRPGEKINELIEYSEEYSVSSADGEHMTVAQLQTALVGLGYA